MEATLAELPQRSHHRPSAYPLAPERGRKAEDQVQHEGHRDSLSSCDGRETECAVRELEVLALRRLPHRQEQAVRRNNASVMGEVTTCLHMASMLVRVQPDVPTRGLV
jgi:hypothetical protein